MAQPSSPGGETPQLGATGDSRDALSLEEILRLYNQPINEEQAWAVCFQCCGSLRAAAARRQPHRRVRSAAQIRVWRDGAVTLAPAAGEEGEPPPASGKLGYSHCTETEVIESLGIIIYKALDYGLKENEERELSPPLEQLIDQMANTVEADGNHDEGYEAADECPEDEDGEKRIISAIRSYQDVMKICAAHLPAESEAPNHYQAVCRALFAETMELHTFLTKIKSAKENLKKIQEMEQTDESSPDLEDLKNADWARFWVQVMRDLRNGVKLKKVQQRQYNPLPIEYQLTPYEMLMDDIRCKRYTLRKVMVSTQTVACGLLVGNGLISILSSHGILGHYRAVVAHTFNPSTQETDIGRSLCSRPAWSTESVPGQPGLHRETLSEKKRKEKAKKEYLITVENLEDTLSSVRETYKHIIS